MTYPCGVPANIAGPCHVAHCIACQRIGWAERPYTTATAEADPHRGEAHPRVVLRFRRRTGHRRHVTKRWAVA